MKRCSASLIIRECKSKLQGGIISHQSEWPSSKNRQTLESGEGVDKREPSCIVGGNVSWYSYFKKLKIKLPYDPAIPLLCMYPEKTTIQKDTCTPMFIAAIFTIARTWKKHKCPSTDEWIKKMWCIYNAILLSHKKEQNWVVYSDMDEPRVCITEWSKSEREKQISSTNTHIWHLEKWYWRTYFQGKNRE